MLLLILLQASGYGFSCEGEIMVSFEMLLFFVLDVRKGCILVCSQVELELSISEVQIAIFLLPSCGIDRFDFYC
jgi:hypothetical protein